jgi:hypothetical protein
VRDLEAHVLGLAHAVLGGAMERQARVLWLQRPGREESGSAWPVVQRLYHALTGMELPEVMQSRGWRRVDAVITLDGELPRIIEVDESQHFNACRALTIRGYPASARVAFDRVAWLVACDAKKRLEGGGWGRPCPPLFPGEGGRHRQRAFRDALTDLLPAEHGWQPTLRIADFEVLPWVQDADAEPRMRELLDARLSAT